MNVFAAVVHCGSILYLFKMVKFTILLADMQLMVCTEICVEFLYSYIYVHNIHSSSL